MEESVNELVVKIHFNYDIKVEEDK